MKYKVKIYPQPYIYEIEADDEAEAEMMILDGQHFQSEDVLKTITMPAYCPRCIEDYTDEDGEEIEGEEVESDCEECGVCADCEHLSECSQSN